MSLSNNDVFTFPMSYAQQRLWILDQYQQAQATYNICAALRFNGTLDTEALQQSISYITERHEILRTVFALENGTAVQMIHSSMPVDFAVTDRMPELSVEEQTSRFISTVSAAPFNLEQGPLLRFRLLRLQEDVCVLVIVMHHIISDGWSLGVLVREMTTVYTALKHGEPVCLPELPIQYADYSEWQRTHLAEGRMAQLMTYWKRQLDDIPALVTIAGNRERPLTASTAGAVHQFALDLETAEDLRILSRRSGSSFYMIFLAAYALLAASYTGEEDVLIGSPTANRGMEDIEGLIGFFVNTLVLRVSVRAGMPFRELLQQVQEVVLAALEHQDMPFEQLVAELNPTRSTAHSPLFQLFFAFQNVPRETVVLPGCTVQPLEAESHTAKFDLSLFMEEDGITFKGKWEYNTDLYTPEAIARLAKRFVTLLQAIAKDADVKPGMHTLLSTEERRQVLTTWNNTYKAYPEAECVHTWFEKKAALCPNAIAVVWQKEELTYALLNEQANSVAAWLRQNKVGNGSPVGIYMERGMDAMVCMLGILKAGGAYVPMDPIYPADRIAHMITNAGIGIILTSASLQSSLPGTGQYQIIIAEDLRAYDLQDGQHNPVPVTTPAQPAYIIFTSGSTGKPKGVPMQHQSLVNLLAWQLEQPHFAAGARVLQYTSLSFDVSFQEILSTWLSGGTLILISEAHRKDPEMLARCIADQQITRLFVPYIVLQQVALFATDHKLVMTGLREVITAGEQLKITPPIQHFFTHCCPSGTLVNQYGPTEAHVVSSYVLAAGTNWPELPPIGKPISNTQLYILDKQLQPVAPGVPGELYIAGACLSPGYVNAPELTHEKFVFCPFNEQYPVMYKTGDTALFLPNGDIAYISRNDDQVKIRGYRVEPEETERVLRACPGVRDAAIVVKKNGADKYLAAYVVATTNVAAIHEQLKGALPAYMVPTEYVFLESLPVTVNGKIDKRTLLSYTGVGVAANTSTAPANDVEKQLCDIWEQLLGRRPGVCDDFFEWGGHSLALTYLSHHIYTAFGVQLGFGLLLENPVLQQQAALIMQHTAQVADTIVPAPFAAAYPASGAQEQIWIACRDAAQATAYHIAGALEITGMLDAAALAAAFLACIDRHEILRTAVYMHTGGQLLQQVLPAHAIAFELKRVFCKDDNLLPTLLQEEAAMALDIDTGVVLRAVLYECGNGRYVLQTILHHIAGDEWSVRILQSELLQLYAAGVNKQPATLAPLLLQYKDYTHWEQRYLASDRYAADKQYWNDRFLSMPADLKLPIDSVPDTHSDAGAHTSILIPAADAESLRALTRQYGISESVLFMTALYALLYKYTGQTELVVGLPVAQRDHLQLAGQMGPYINMLPCLLKCKSTATMQDLVEQVKDTMQEAFLHMRYPFHETAQQWRTHKIQSLQVVLNVLNNDYTALADPALPGLTFTPVNSGYTGSKFPLCLYVYMQDGAYHVKLEYQAALFKPGTIDKMGQRLKKLLVQMPGVMDKSLLTLTLDEKPVLPAFGKIKL